MRDGEVAGSPTDMRVWTDRGSLGLIGVYFKTGDKAAPSSCRCGAKSKCRNASDLDWAQVSPTRVAVHRDIPKLRGFGAFRAGTPGARPMFGSAARARRTENLVPVVTEEELYP